MTSLARNALLLIAPVSVGCAQIPAPPSYSEVLPDSRALLAKGGPLDTVRPVGYQEKNPNQKGPTPLGQPRTFDPSQTTGLSAAELLNGPATLDNLEELADRV